LFEDIGRDSVILHDSEKFFLRFNDRSKPTG
jgi:hypothetical protein